MTQSSLKTHNPVTMYHIATQFLMASHRCMRKESFQSRSEEALDIPSIVNVAFAAEVLLKSLLQTGNSIKKRSGHHLAILFSSLPEHHRAFIRNKVEQEFDKFDERLESVSRCFESWRYVYEVETLSLPNNQFLHKFTHTMADYVARCLGISPLEVMTLVRPIGKRK